MLPEDSFLAARPEGVDASAAGAAPVAALTAIAASDALSPAEGEDVLVIGGTGGAGSFFMQLAASAGANAILLKEGGRLASPLGAAGEGAGRFDVMAVPSPANLERPGEPLAAGTLRVPVQRSYTLEQAGEALQALPTAHTQGKLGVTLA